jgi:hypothetical protein
MHCDFWLARAMRNSHANRASGRSKTHTQILAISRLREGVTHNDQATRWVKLTPSIDFAVVGGFGYSAVILLGGACDNPVALASAILVRFSQAYGCVPKLCRCSLAFPSFSFGPFGRYPPETHLTGEEWFGVSPQWWCQWNRDGSAVVDFR